MTSRSPTILPIAWGSTEVGGIGRFKDAKLYPGGGKAWDWRETGTQHVPGIQPADVEELIQRGSSRVDRGPWTVTVTGTVSGTVGRSE